MLRLRASVGLAAIALLAACSSGDPSSADTMSATINGNPWRAGHGGGASRPDAVFHATTSNLQLLGTDASGDSVRTLSLVIAAYTGEGTYTLADTSTGTYAFLLTSKGQLDSPNFTIVSHWSDATHTGSVVVTGDDGTRITGTFSVLLTNPLAGTRSVTAGAFSLPLRHLNSSPAP